MKAIFLSTFKFPDGDAGSLRYSFFGKLFANNGFDPYFVGKGKSSICKYSTFKYGVYTSLRSKNNSFIFKIFDTLIWFERKILFELKKILKPNDIVVISCFFSKSTNKKIINIAKNKNVKVLFAVEEKYTKSEIKFFDLISYVGYIKCASFYKNIKHYNKPIIAISSYIANFAKEANVPCIVIPFIYDEKLSMPLYLKTGLPVKRFIYAGTPGKKDLLLEMIKGFDLLPSNFKSKIEVNIYGVHEKQAKKWFSTKLYKRISKFVNFYTNVKREQLINAIMHSDFSILLRNSDEEFAKAGFPTKISESLFYGVPPITNISSDLNDYLIDKYNSIIVEGCDKRAFCRSILTAINMSEKELMQLKINARETSISRLTIKPFTTIFNNFLLKV